MCEDSSEIAFSEHIANSSVPPGQVGFGDQKPQPPACIWSGEERSAYTLGLEDWPAWSINRVTSRELPAGTAEQLRVWQVENSW